MLDGSTGAQKTIYLGANPVSIDVNPLTNKVYVANEGYEPSTPGSLWEIDGVTNHASTFGTGYTLPFYPSQVLVDPVTNTILCQCLPIRRYI
jgi:DNA-binding beta-propeller fold protein YncE